MQGKFRSVFGAGSVILFLSSGTVALGEVPVSGPEKSNAAFAELERVARARRAEGTLPRLSVPTDAKVLNQFWDASAILGTPPYKAGDLPRLLDIFEKQNAVFKTYMFFSQAPGTLPRADANVATFQDEIARSIVFMLKAMSAVAQASDDFIAGLKPEEFDDERRQGFVQLRLGLVEMVSSAGLLVRSPGVSEHNRSHISDAIAENLVGIASVMSRPDREAIVGALKAARPVLSSSIQARMDPVLEKVLGMPCDRLCASR